MLGLESNFKLEVKMKFRDIPKFTRTPTWHTDMPLDHFKIRFEEFID